MKPDTENNSAPSSTDANNAPAHPTPAASDHPLLPHAAASALSAASDVASDVASSVRTAVDGAVAWTEAKVEKLSAKEEDGTGPYGSLSTCAPSDLDPIAMGVLPALPSEEKKEAVDARETKDEGKEAKGDGQSEKDGEKK